MINTRPDHHGIMAKGGDFESVFAFRHAGLCKLVGESYDRYRISIIDPDKDWQHRELTGVAFEAPVQDNLKELFDLMHAHARRYVHAQYVSELEIENDRALNHWVAELNALIPNGVSEILGDKITRDGVARLIGAFIYMATVQHEALGTNLWNYQLWVHKHPVRVYSNGQREPVDVYQRLVNANFNLNVNRAQLMRDFTYLDLSRERRDRCEALRPVSARTFGLCNHRRSEGRLEMRRRDASSRLHCLLLLWGGAS